MEVILSKYEYTGQIQAEIEHMVRLAIPLPRVLLTRATLGEDLGGIDVHYMINGRCPLQIRTRFNRPAYAADIDVTFRSTEPSMMAAGTYAPLALFIWVRGQYARAGKLIDTATLYDYYPLEDPDKFTRESNNDGTSWLAVTIPELVKARALLRQGDEREWAAARLGGNQRVLDIIKRYSG